MKPDDLVEIPPNLPEPLRAAAERADTEAGFRRLAWVVGAVLALGLLAFVAKGADGPPDPRVEDVESATGAVPAAAARAAVPPFGQVSIRFVTDGRAAGPFCALLADAPEQRAQGMMGRQDQGGHEAMVFRFPDDTAAQFYMRNVPIPLSIAWFDAAGRFVDATDMAPCADQEGCPLYGAKGPYRFAVEVPQGGLAALGVGPGTVLQLGGPCSG